MYKSINLKDINTAEAQNFLQHAIVPRRKMLSGNRLGQLANVYEMPVIDPSFEDKKLKNIFQYFCIESCGNGKRIAFICK